MPGIWVTTAVAAAVAALAWRQHRTRKARAQHSISRSADPDSVRETTQGRIVGFLEPGGTHAWLGIPYAASPVGDLRWKAPRPPVAWAGTREALTHGPIAVQFAGITIGAPRAQWGQVVGSEDCLTLNIHAPRFEAGAVPRGADRRPVMVWLHGGANTVGTANTYGVLRNLAAHDDVVVVGVNHRLGLLGWFNLPDLHDAHASAEDRSGNYGTLDLIAALRWVRDNIGAFGGDPDNVTIFGESAGALNVYALMASPLARGLFHKAIAQSPLNITATVAQGRHLVDDAEPGHERSARELVCAWLVREGRAPDQAAARRLLRSMTPPEVRNFALSRTPAQLHASIEAQMLGFFASPRLFHDGHVLPLEPFDEVFADRSRYNAVPLIVGCNRDEYKIFMAQNPEHVHLRFGVLPVMKDRARYLRMAHYMSRLWKAETVNGLATQMVRGGHGDVWVYRFDWDEQPKLPLVQPQLSVGAAHAVEIPFVMRDTRGEYDPFHSNTRANLPGREQVSQAMADAWTALARHGRPHAPGQSAPAWAPWTDDPRAARLRVFDTPADGGVRMTTDTLDHDSLVRELAEDTSFANERERCAMFARMYVWSEFAPQSSQGQRPTLQSFNGGACAAWSAEDLRPATWP